MLKPTLPFAIMLALLSASLITGFNSFRHTKQHIEADMQQALTLTLREKQSDVITADTIRTFNNHLQWADLRGQAVLALSTRKNELRLQVHCPTLTIWRLSDQRPSMALASMALIMAAGCGIRRRKPAPSLPQIGSLSYSEGHHCFYNERHEEVRFTPMQQQLMELFFHAEGYRLTKQEICNALWPKKDDASETLYTLIRRLKTILESQARLTILSDRGRSYRLTIND